MEHKGTFLRNEPCPKCGSRDNVGVWTDGKYCFSGCGYKAPSAGEEQPKVVSTMLKKNLLQGGEYVALKKRRISAETCQMFRYQIGQANGQPVQIANYLKDGHIVAQHIRTADKDFTWRGNAADIELFGQHLWRGGGRKVVVTEGELDAMSISEAQENKWPVVSVPNGAQSAAKYLKQNLEFLESYETVVLAFDNDPPGREAAEECAQLLSPGKAFIASYPDGVKDASDLLQAGRVEELIRVTWQAKPWRPDGIKNAADLLEEVRRPIEWGLSYPWASLTQQTYGIRLNELVALGAGTGLGKTEVLKEIATHLLVHHKQNVGLLFLEEANRDTVLSIMGKQASVLFHIPDAQYSEVQFKEAWDATAGTGRLFLYDHFGSSSWEVIKSRIRYLVINCGCRYLFLDHITALVSGDKDGDERKALDFIMTELASLVRQLNINIHVISHLATPEGKPHEEGGRVQIRHFRGSRSIGQWSSFLLGLERNQQSENIAERHTSTLRVLKDRYTGRATGFTMPLAYDQATGRLSEGAVVTENPFGDATQQWEKEDF